MTTEQHDQTDSTSVDAAAVANKLAAAGSMEAIQETGALDALMDQIDRSEIALSGRDGFIQQIIRAGLQRGLQAELTGHLGYEKHAAESRGTENYRNGSYPKRVATVAGHLDIAVPRDGTGTFTPTLVPKGSRRTGGLDEMIISLYAGGMTVRDISPTTWNPRWAPSCHTTPSVPSPMRC